MFTFYILVLLYGSAWGDIYYDPVESPYDDGLLPVDSRIINPNINPINPAPMHSKVYYPDETNMTESYNYGVFYFIPGFFGSVPPALYDDLMEDVSAHGYVVISVWPLSTGDGVGGINFTAEAHIANVDFLKENLPINIRGLADFDYLALGCNSAGCGSTLGMARIDPEPYMALVNLEPVSFFIVGGADFVLPSIHLGAELANMSCAIPNVDFERFYAEYECPKIMMEAYDAGHCDLLTDAGRAACGVFCATSESTDLAAYRRFVKGLTTAFLNAHVQGNMAALDHVTDPASIPYPLKQHKMDLDC